MAGKPTKKNGKSKSETKATTQSKPAVQAKSAAPAKSTVTPISQPTAAGEMNEQVGSHADEAVATQSGTPVTVMEEIRTTVVRLADQEIIEEIRVRAYEFFEQRGRHEGHDHEDWTRAEAEILAKYQREKSA